MSLNHSFWKKSKLHFDSWFWKCIAEALYVYQLYFSLQGLRSSVPMPSRSAEGFNIRFVVSTTLSSSKTHFNRRYILVTTCYWIFATLPTRSARSWKCRESGFTLRKMTKSYHSCSFYSLKDDKSTKHWLSLLLKNLDAMSGTGGSGATPGLGPPTPGAGNGKPLVGKLPGGL